MLLVVGAVFLMTLFPAVNTALIKKDAGPLVGVGNEYVMPEFTLSAFRDGTYQSQFEKAYSKGFSGYRAAMRALNELRFRLFGEVGNTVACKDGSVIFENYIEEYLGLSETHYCTEEYLDQLTAQLERIRDLAEMQGKRLVVVVTPNKAGFIADQIPDRYYRMEQVYTAAQRGAPQLVARMEEAGIDYVDGVTLLQSQEWEFDVFPETGIHWTREAAMQVVDELIDCWESDGTRLKRVEGVGRVQETEPRRGSKNNDDDVWLLMNIFSDPKTQYTYPVEETVIPENYDTPAVFVQGGSFSYSINELLTDHDVVRDLNFLFYAQSLYDYQGDAAPVADLWDASIRQKVRDSDIILLEVNEGAVYSMGAGFYPVLEEILRGGIYASAPVEKAFQVQYRGMGPWESANGVNWRWAYGKNAMLVFEGALPTDTLQVQFWVPYTQYTAQGLAAGEAVELEVYVNGSRYQTVSCTQDLVFHVQIDSSRLIAGQDNVVEIRSPYTFPANTYYGMKDLSVQILGAWRAG